MLRGIDPLLGPELLHALAAMGHGDRIALVDANYPATSGARRLITMPGVDATAVLRAVLTVLPIDTFIDDPTVTMQVVGDEATTPDAVRDFTSALADHGAKPPLGVDRHRFYELAATSFAIVLTGERRLYGNIILTKGVVGPGER